MAYKMQVLHCLSRRAQAARAAGRHVLLAGDFNIAPQPIDHCDPGSEFRKRGDRRWLAALLSADHEWRAPAAACGHNDAPSALDERRADEDTDAVSSGSQHDADLRLAEQARDALLAQQEHVPGENSACSACAHLSAVAEQLQQLQPPGAAADRQLQALPCGGFIDTFRHFKPDAPESYTCWNTATGARANNWGTRIDLLLAADPAPAACGPRAAVCPAGSADICCGGSVGHDAARGGAGAARVGWRWADAMVAADVQSERSGSDHAPAWLEVAAQAMAPCAPAAAVAAGAAPLPESAQAMLSAQGKQASLAKLWQGVLL